MRRRVTALLFLVTLWLVLPAGGALAYQAAHCYEVIVGLLSADFVWYSQVALIVVGHVIAVYLAHGISLRLLHDKKRAVRSQCPMVALMVLYTIFSLWILNQPVIGETKVASALFNLI